jgi:hypothetical protein
VGLSPLSLLDSPLVLYLEVVAMLLQKIRQVIAIALVVTSSSFVGFAVYILNSLPDQIAESKSALEKNQLLQDIRDVYNSSQTAQP